MSQKNAWLLHTGRTIIKFKYFIEKRNVLNAKATELYYLSHAALKTDKDDK